MFIKLDLVLPKGLSSLYSIYTSERRDRSVKIGSDRR